jgi:hypothetical protein
MAVATTGCGRRSSGSGGEMNDIYSAIRGSVWWWDASRGVAESVGGNGESRRGRRREGVNRRYVSANMGLRASFW